MTRRLLLLALCAAFAGGPSVADSFVNIYGGWAWNDEDSGIEDGDIYGLRLGAEVPVGGAEASLDFNRSGDIHLDSLVFSGIANLYSRDGRSSGGGGIVNRFSFFATGGAGLLRREQPEDDTDTFLVFEYGLGLQYRFSRIVGMRIEALALDSPPGNLRTYEGTGGISFYW